MSIKKLIQRSAETAIKLPFAMAWDVISLGNVGDGSSTGKVLREHKERKFMDDCEDYCKRLRRIERGEQ